MKNPQGQINLRAPIEYLVFAQIPVQITLNDEAETQLHGHIIDRIDRRISVELSGRSSSDSEFPESGTTGRVSCNYKSMRLGFEVTVCHATRMNQVLELDTAEFGQLQDHRNWQRARFMAPGDSLEAHLRIETVGGEVSFRTSHLKEFSYETLALLLDRRQGLALPNDLVTELTIRRGGELLFEATGRVVRIEKGLTGDAEREEYLAAIELDDPNKPKALDIEPNKRRSDRVSLLGHNDAFLDFTHPFLESRATAYIVDLSNSGLSILMDDAKYALPPGLVVSNATLQLPLRPRLPVSLRVKAYHLVGHEDKQTCRISLAFVGVSPELIKEVSAFVQQVNSEHLVDARPEDYEQLWEFYFETGFIYDSKRRQIQDYAREVRHTYDRLLASETPIIKKILYKDEGRILGHITAVKAFDHTLLVQHLNALKVNNGSAAHAVIRGMTTFFLDHEANKQAANRYVCAYYRPNNLYPVMVFGQTAELISDPWACWTRQYEFCLPGKPDSVEVPGYVVYREANDDDKEALETLLVERGEYGLLRLEGLARDQVTDMHVSDEYERIGLYRYRRMFVAEDLRHRRVAYAVCNYASPGLNLSELTNGVKFFYDAPIDAHSQDLADALGGVILASYEQTEMAEPVLLLAPGQPVPHGFKREKLYTLWALDLAYVKKFRDATEHIFANVREFVRRSKAS